MPEFSALILAAGQGTRMHSDIPKVMHEIGGRSLLHHVLASVLPLEPKNIGIVLAPSMSKMAEKIAPYSVIYQEKPLGTGDAVKSARADWGHRKEEDVLILYGDTPFIGTDTLRELIARRRAPDNPALVMLAMRPSSNYGYGRCLIDADGYLRRIVEEKDATEGEKEIALCNGGVMIADGSVLWQWLDEIQPHNAKAEYYLTDLVALAWEKRRKVAYREAPEEELLGINDRKELAKAEKIFQEKKRAEAMAAGVTLQDPETVYFSADTRWARDCIIGPHVFFGPGVFLHEGVEIRPFCHLEGVEIQNGARIGPFARLRPDSVIGAGAHIGNFVEVKNTLLEENAKANHLSYLGDSHVGAGANIGAGTITCNYDGFRKSATKIGAGAFIGSNTALIAPVTIGKGAIIGAGSVITKDVGENSLALTRMDQQEKPGWAARFREWRKK